VTKASSVVAGVTQQSRQRVPQSRTEYREHPKATWVQTARQAEEKWQSVDDISVPSRRQERNRQQPTDETTPQLLMYLQVHTSSASTPTYLSHSTH